MRMCSKEKKNGPNRWQQSITHAWIFCANVMRVDPMRVLSTNHPRTDTYVTIRRFENNDRNSICILTIICDSRRSCESFRELITNEPTPSSWHRRNAKWHPRRITHAHSLAYIIIPKYCSFESFRQFFAQTVSLDNTQRTTCGSDAKILNKVLRLRPGLRNFNIEIWQSCKINYCN
jgi:hypothetical protein